MSEQILLGTPASASGCEPEATGPTPDPNPIQQQWFSQGSGENERAYLEQFAAKVNELVIAREQFRDRVALMFELGPGVDYDRERLIDEARD